jgi:hypothetical protein
MYQSIPQADFEAMTCRNKLIQTLLLSKLNNKIKIYLKRKKA